MRSSSSPSGMIEQIDGDIAETERLIHERVQSLIVSLRRGADISLSEKRIGEMRNALELLHSQRRKLIRSAYQDRARSREEVAHGTN